jgi:hypothetical protein
MAENEKTILSDKSVIPTDEYIFSLIGNNKHYWKRIMDHVSENYMDTLGSWNYYNDGKQWLFKMVHKKKTIFWSRVINGTFRITFYLGNKAEAILDDSDLPQTLKDDFKTAKRYGLIRPVSFEIHGEPDVENVLKLIAIKAKMK